MHHARELDAAIAAHEAGERLRRGEALPRWLERALERRPGANRRGLRGFGGGGGGPAAWTMADLTGIAEDWDSRFGVTDVSGACSAWTGQIAGEVMSQGTAGNRPTIGTRDGVQALRCATDWLELTSFATITITQPSRIVLVVEPVSVTSVDYYVDGSTVRNLWRISSSLEWEMYAGAFFSSGIAASAAATALVGVYDGVSSKAFVDDLATAAATGNAGAFDMDGITVGASPGGSFAVPDAWFFRAVLANGGDTSDHPDLGAHLDSVYAALTLTY